MASNLRVDQILPSTSTNVAIGTATGTVTLAGTTSGTFSGNLTGSVNSTGVTTVTTLRATSIVGVTTAGITTAYIGSVNDGPLSGTRNRIINGDMRIDQRNSGAAVTINATNDIYTLDRFFAYGQSTDGVYTVQQSTTAPTGFANSLKVTVTTADSSVGATQYYFLSQRIEGTNVADFAFGTASAQTVTVSFYVRSSVTGTFSGALSNGALNRSYPFNYTISAADTWERKTITIPGDTTGTWVTTTARGMHVSFDLGCGSNNVGTANTWAGSEFYGVTGATKLISTLNATFYITGVQLEVGTVATQFERRSYGQELALCRRYYKKGLAVAGNSGQSLYGSQYGASNAANNIDIDMPSFRTAPNLSLLNNSNVQYYSYGGAWTASTLTITSIGVWPSSLLYLYSTADGDGRGKLLRCTNATDVHWVADAEL
jgi:hypothetical protein